MRIVALLFALILAGCTTARVGGVPTPELRYPTVVVGYGSADMNVAGMTYSKRGTQIIEMKPGQKPRVQRRVVAHELLHTAGYKQGDHADDPACFFYGSARDIVPDRPCPYELEMIRRVTNIYHVRVHHAKLEADVRWAVNFWNHWAGRTVFVMK